MSGRQTVASNGIDGHRLDQAFSWLEDLFLEIIEGAEPTPHCTLRPAASGLMRFLGDLHPTIDLGFPKSTWVMMLAGFVGLGFAGAGAATLSRAAPPSFHSECREKAGSFGLFHFACEKPSAGEKRDAHTQISGNGRLS